MSVVSKQAPSSERDAPGRNHPEGRMLFDLGAIDLSQRFADSDEIARWNPHRGNMAFIDAIVWVGDDFRQGLAIHKVRDDEFWVEGHFPGDPMMPGVLMLEAGAQLACYMFNARKKENVLAIFLRIERAAFRSSVTPGDDFYLLCKQVKFGRRQFVTDIQGVVGRRIAFDARIRGMTRLKDE